MSTELLNAAAKYIIALAVVGGCFAIILTTSAADNTQPWSVITLIVGWLIRDSAGNSATSNAVRTMEAAKVG